MSLTTVAVNMGGTGAATSTGTGAVVLSNSPTLVTPTLGVATFSAGTVSAPSITTSGDTNTGIFFPAADTIAFSEGGVESARFDSAGNLGIGTNSPLAKLNVARTDSTLIGLFSGTTRGARIGTNSVYSFIEGVDNTGSASYQPFMIGGSEVRFTTSDVERMRIDSSGRVKINTIATVSTASNEVLAVDAGTAGGYGGVFASNTSGGFGCIYLKTGSNVPNLALFYRDTTLVGSITTGGTTTAYNSSSDYRLKENIAPMTGALDKVAALKPCTYTWKADGSSGQGFIAHELQQVVPDCVTGEKDAVDADGNIKAQGIDTSFLIATLTAAIQELKATVDAQAARIAALEELKALKP